MKKASNGEILTLCEGRKPTTRLVKWLMKKRLLKRKIKCRLCKNKLKLQPRSGVIDGLQWICRHKSHRQTAVKKSLRSGSFFEKSKISLNCWLTYIYRFTQGLRMRQVDMLQDGLARSTRTLSKMSKALRKICIKAMKRKRRKTGQWLGGHDEFVIVDESNFCHRRKYGRGRYGRTWRRRKWVFGLLGIRGDRRRPILRLVKKRSRQHLLPVIRRHVRQGTTIISDQWRAYMGALPAAGYTHFTVNHSMYFIDPYSGAHTQNIERAWGIYKNQIWRLRGNRNEDHLKRHLAFIEWTYWLGNKHKGGPFGRLLKDIHRKFPI